MAVALPPGEVENEVARQTVAAKGAAGGKVVAGEKAVVGAKAAGTAGGKAAGPCSPSCG